MSLAAILAAAGLLALLAGVSNWVTIGLAVWLMLCYASLCFPDNIWDRWMPPESP